MNSIGAKLQGINGSTVVDHIQMIQMIQAIQQMRSDTMVIVMVIDPLVNTEKKAVEDMARRKELIFTD